VNTKIIRSLCVSGLCLAGITFFILEGCKKELPQTGVSKPEQAKVKKGHKELGLELYEKGKNAEAIAELKKAIADNTADAEVYYKLASVYYDEEMTNDAINMYKKVIEILTFDSSNNPVFGNELFKVGKQKKSRLFFEYSNKSAMTLTYNEKLNMIVFDHLSPSRKIYEGQYRYYGPDLSYDALEWDKNKWVLLEDIDVRNEKEKVKKKDVNLTPTQRLLIQDN